ncbi:unnamed protein product [Prorocentrum cordatum]|uniref:Uncharacterized protein n=1 Tax=Prorocentrum cordatum TaxID=2364126 RepID=A0ABN9TQ75_9DINO|nr:unnamed protein product [Polarella glacialis]
MDTCMQQQSRGAGGAAVPATAEKQDAGRRPGLARAPWRAVKRRSSGKAREVTEYREAVQGGPAGGKDRWDEPAARQLDVPDAPSSVNDKTEHVYDRGDMKVERVGCNLNESTYPSGVWEVTQKAKIRGAISKSKGKEHCGTSRLPRRTSPMRSSASNGTKGEVGTVSYWRTPKIDERFRVLQEFWATLIQGEGPTNPKVKPSPEPSSSSSYSTSEENSDES